MQRLAASSARFLPSLAADRTCTSAAACGAFAGTSKITTIKTT